MLPSCHPQEIGLNNTKGYGMISLACRTIIPTGRTRSVGKCTTSCGDTVKLFRMRREWCAPKDIDERAQTTHPTYDG